jgi:hypothetical protein
MFSLWNANIRPCSDDDDYDIDFYTADQNTQEATDPTAPSPREQLEVRFRVVLRKLTLTSFLVFGWLTLNGALRCVLTLYQGYYRAAHALARISRTIARQLWRPSTDQDGIPLDSVLSYISDLSKWRDAHLSKVGVPPNLEANWDFVSAVSACK